VLVSDKSHLKNASGRRYTKGLFYEMTLEDKSSVSYTLKDRDYTDRRSGKTYPSLKRLYMEVADPTEYLFAEQHLDGWDHWLELVECTWFKDYADRWRSELEVKLRAEALRRIKLEAKSTSKNAFTANKLLLDGGWKDKSQGGSKPVGRPSKEAVKAAEAQMKFDELTDLDADARRLGLN
jgi:hypothetical protein